MQFFSERHYGAQDFATFYEAIPVDSAQKPRAVCSLLDVTPDTLKRYLSGKSNPPKALVRLLFHECPFGRSATDTHSHNGHVLAVRQLQCVQAELDRLRGVLASLEIENGQLKQAVYSEAVFAANSSRWVA
jgi:hypothetical protein